MVRFNFYFNDEIKTSMISFAEENKDEERKALKEKWLSWVNDNKDLIETSHQSLKNDGYEGTIEDLQTKIFTSIRYYYIKQLRKSGDEKWVKTKPKNTTTKKTSKSSSNKTYVRFDPSFINEMDAFVKQICEEKNYIRFDGEVIEFDGTTNRPIKCYEAFNKSKGLIIAQEQTRFLESYDTMSEVDFEKRVKKSIQTRLLKKKRSLTIE
jgi:hypothetical protein